MIHLDLADGEVARRVLARRLCAGCGMDYSLIDNSPSTEGRCDARGGELVRREDDAEEVLAVRRGEYRAKTNPVLDIFRRKGIRDHGGLPATPGAGPAGHQGTGSGCRPPARRPRAATPARSSAHWPRYRS